MQSKSKIGVAIAGLGFGESVHIPAIKSNDQFNLKALWHPNPERVAICSQKYNLIPFHRWDELLNDSSIQAIIIATPPKPRFELAKEAIKAGKHLLLEKPVGLNHIEIEELQRLSIRYRSIVAVDFEYRAVPLFMQAKRIIANELLGKIWLTKFDWIMSSRSDSSRKWNWYSDKNQGGGVIGALGTHAFDTLNWLIGKPIMVNSLQSTSINERFCAENNVLKKVTSEDISLSQLELISHETNEKIPAQVSISSISKNGRGCWIEIYGSRGTLILGSDNQKDYVHGFNLWLSENNAPLRNITADDDLIFTRTWTDGRVAPVARIQNWWGDSINHGTPIIPGLGEAVESQKVCDKIKEYGESGQ